MSQVSQGRVGSLTGSDGAVQPLRLGRDGGVATQDAHARYQEAVVRGNVYFVSLSNASPTAYTGASAGTPLLDLKNPTGSGKAAVLLGVAVSVYTQATSAGSGDLAIYVGNNTAVTTASKTNPTNALTFLSQGSAMSVYANTALTGSSALSFYMATQTYYWATAASAYLTPSFLELGGTVVVAPGNEVAIGIQVLPAGTTVNITLIWEEVPYP